MLTHRRFKACSLSVLVILGLILGTFCLPSCSGYSVLTHEAIIDAAWKESIVPVLLKRFPNATPEQLLEAHSYAYGGAIIQDMGILSAIAGGAKQVSGSVKVKWVCGERTIRAGFWKAEEHVLAALGRSGNAENDRKDEPQHGLREAQKSR